MINYRNYTSTGETITVMKDAIDLITKECAILDYQHDGTQSYPLIMLNHVILMDEEGVIDLKGWYEQLASDTALSIDEMMSAVEQEGYTMGDLVEETVLKSMKTIH